MGFVLYFVNLPSASAVMNFHTSRSLAHGLWLFSCFVLGWLGSYFPLPIQLRTLFRCGRTSFQVVSPSWCRISRTIGLLIRRLIPEVESRIAEKKTKIFMFTVHIKTFTSLEKTCRLRVLSPIPLLCTKGMNTMGIIIFADDTRKT